MYKNKKIRILSKWSVRKRYVKGIYGFSEHTIKDIVSK